MARVLALLAFVASAFAFAPLPTTTPRRTVAPLQMANNAGALKRIKTNERNRVRNAAWRSKVRTLTRKTKEAIEAGDADLAKECARQTTSAIDRATRRGIYHKNWAARNKSRLSKNVIALILESRGETKKEAPVEA
jgi:small subunit ribosomal protein S20